MDASLRRGINCSITNSDRATQHAAMAGRGEEAVVSAHTLDTRLGTMMRIEAAIWTNTRGRGGIPIEDFYSMARSYEWLGLGVNNQSKNGSVTSETKSSTYKRLSKAESMICSDVNEIIDTFTEMEILLFDFVTATGWKPDDPNLYPLYRLYLPSNKAKIHLEILQRPQETKSTSTIKSSITTSTRSEILQDMYFGCKNFSLTATAGHDWGEHAKSVAQMILDHRKSMTSSTREDSAEIASLKPIASNTNKMTLEDRVHARSLRNPTTSMSKQPSNAGESTQQIENKALLELATSLRSFSQRRGASFGGGSAVDRLRNRGSSGVASGALATKTIARLTVTDLIRDARITWNSIVSDSTNLHDRNIGNKSGRGGATSLVNVDLSSVLFLLRLKMISTAGVLDKREMELQLLALLEKLSTLVPKWIHLHKAPFLTGSIKPGAGTSNNQQNGALSNQKSTIKQSILVIRNDSVDYAVDVRAKLGGRVHNTAGSAKGDNNVKLSNGNKRSILEMRGQPTGVADAIVPPSFRRMYGTALGLESSTKDGR